MIARILRKCGSSLLAAKILVICRLLYKGLSRNVDYSSQIEATRKRLASLHSRLLRRIDGQFCDEGSTDHSLLDHMCAYLLATSSAPTDVLRHFLHIRHERIMYLLEGTGGSHVGASQAMRLYLQTVEQAHSLLPGRLASLLVRFRSRPLIEDPEIRALANCELNIDKSWLPEELCNFTPWLHHDLLQRPAVESVLGLWTKSTFNSLIEALRRSLGGVQDLTVMVQKRRDLLETWLAQAPSQQGHESQERLLTLRFVIVDRLKQLISNQAAKLEAVTSKVVAALQDWTDEYSPVTAGLWSSSIMSIDVGPGAVRLKAAVLDHLHGRSRKLRQVTKYYFSWLGQIETWKIQIKRLKEESWDDSLDLEMDDLELKPIGTQLCDEDPNQLEAHLVQSVTSAFGAMQNTLQDSLKVLMPQLQRQQASSLLRIIRDIREHQPQEAEVPTFCLEITSELYTSVASALVRGPVQRFEQRLSIWKPQKMVVLSTLWEGSPSLPTQPSPVVFGFLYDIMTAMSNGGSDLWTPTSIDRIKLELRRSITGCLDMLRASMADEIANDNKSGDRAGASLPHDRSQNDSERSEEVSAESAVNNDSMAKFKVQALFDVLVLQTALELSQQLEQGNELDEFEQELLGDLDEEALLVDGLRRHVMEFWKRSTLLFALLVQH